MRHRVLAESPDPWRSIRRSRTWRRTRLEAHRDCTRTCGAVATTGRTWDGTRHPDADDQFHPGVARASIHTGIRPVILDPKVGRTAREHSHVCRKWAPIRDVPRPATRERTACGCRSSNCASTRCGGWSPAVVPATAPARRRRRDSGRMPRRSSCDWPWTAPTAVYLDALGDRTSFNDPNNWSHSGRLGGGVGVPGVPIAGSNLVFPPVLLLPAGSPTTINFNSNYASFPVNSDSPSTTRIRSPATASRVGGGIVVTNPVGGAPTDATILLSGVTLGRQATIYTQQGQHAQARRRRPT